MLAVGLIVGAIVAWLVVDHCHVAPGATAPRPVGVARVRRPGFNLPRASDTHPPHELVDLRYG